MARFRASISARLPDGIWVLPQKAQKARRERVSK